MWAALLCRCPGKEEPRENTQRAVTAVAEEPTRFTEHGSEAHDRNIPLCFCKFLYHLKPKVPYCPRQQWKQVQASTQHDRKHFSGALEHSPLHICATLAQQYAMWVISSSISPRASACWEHTLNVIKMKKHIYISPGTERKTFTF